MSEVITRLMEANLLAVFDERDPHRRAAAIGPRRFGPPTTPQWRPASTSPR